MIFAQLAVVIQLAAVGLRGYLHIFASSLLGFILYFLLIFFGVRKYSDAKGSILIGTLLGFLVLQLPIRIYDFNSALLTFPDFVFHLAGILAGYLCSDQQGARKAIYVNILVLCLLIGFYFTFPYQALLNYVNFGAYSGLMKQPISIDNFGIDKTNKIISKQDLFGKVVLLDFWHTRCAACFNGFPALQLAFEQYSSDSEVLIFAFNKPLLGEDKSYPNDVLTKRGFTFNNIVPADSKIVRYFGVDIYPTCIILDKSGTIRFKGDLDQALIYLPKLKEEKY